MSQCAGTNRDGHRCLNGAKATARYCHRHSDQSFEKDALLLGAGAVLGHNAELGIVGVVGGAAVAELASWLFADAPVRKKKVFVSLDFDNDRGLKHLLIGQSLHADSPFEITDGSLLEAAPERDWQAKAKAAIKRADLVIVLVGRHTHRAAGVLQEIEMARLLRKPIVQLIGRRDDNYRRVANAGRLVAWTWPNLKKLLAS
jgi:hypothetical protein